MLFSHEVFVPMPSWRINNRDYPGNMWFRLTRKEAELAVRTYPAAQMRLYTPGPSLNPIAVAPLSSEAPVPSESVIADTVVISEPLNAPETVSEIITQSSENSVEPDISDVSKESDIASNFDDDLFDMGSPEPEVLTPESRIQARFPEMAPATIAEIMKVAGSSPVNLGVALSRVKKIGQRRIPEIVKILQS